MSSSLAVLKSLYVMLRSQLPPNVIMKRTYKRRAALKGRRRRPLRKGKEVKVFSVV